MACLICVIWSTSVGSSGSSDCGSVNTVDVFLSQNAVKSTAPLSHLFILSRPLLVGPFSHLLCSGLDVSFFPHDPVVGCLLFVAVRPLSASTRPGHLPRCRIRLDDSNVWIVFVSWTLSLRNGYESSSS